MITITIDDKPVTVPFGSTILFAANAAGAKIPTLCHDDNLHPYGACRICMVEVMGPQRRLVASCTTPAAEGMVIKTLSQAVLDARRAILEFLLINHPLDCPVCDKAGECRLQDLVHEYTPQKGSFAETKRMLPVDHLSAMIERNTDRCILCGKCVRVCNERIGVHELAFTRRGGQSRISTACDRLLACEFCGECIEVCPVGALTSRQFKYKARPWNVEQTGSICNYCGCGCPVTLETRQNKVVRARAAQGSYLCVKGRFGWDAVHHRDRLTMPKMRVMGALQDCTRDEALSRLAHELQSVRQKNGAASIGGLGSVRTMNEDNYVFQKFMRAVVGSNNVDLLGRSKMPTGLNAAFFSAELGAICESDVIVMLDCNAGEINPRTGIEIVRAVNGKRRKLILVNSGVNKFNRIASVVLPYRTPEAALEALRSGFRTTGGFPGVIDRAVALLCSADRVTIIIPATLTAAGHALVRELAGLLANVVFIPVIRRNNLQGALDMGMIPDYYPGYQKTGTEATAAFRSAWQADLPDVPGINAVDMLNGIKKGNIAALYIMGDDPVGSCPGLAAAFQELDFLAVQDIYLTETAKLAHVVLPAASFVEKRGTVTNLERRLQLIDEAEQPLGESKPDWEIITMLARRMGKDMNYGSAVDVLREIQATVPMYRNLGIGSCWQSDASPLQGSDVDLVLAAGAALNGEVITANRLLFSSGNMITRSMELATISRERGS